MKFLPDVKVKERANAQAKNPVKFLPEIEVVENESIKSRRSDAQAENPVGFLPEENVVEARVGSPERAGSC